MMVVNIAESDIIAETADTLTVCINPKASIRIHWELDKQPSNFGRGNEPVCLRIQTAWGICERTVYDPPLLLP